MKAEYDLITGGMILMDKQETIRKAQSEAESAKSRLINIMYELEEAGAIRQAKSLGTIIAKLETWQSK